MNTPSLFPHKARRPSSRRRTGREGKRLEKLIEQSTVGVRLTQVPQAARVIYRRPKPGQPAAADGKPDTFALKMRGPCDFFGTFVGSGRSLVVDAKESAEKYLLKTRDDHLAPHQRAALVDHGGAGAVAGILCLASITDRLLWCDWGLLVTPRASIPYVEMVDVGPATHAVNWAAVLAAATPLEGGPQA